jgi:hypothetical protein
MLQIMSLPGWSTLEGIPVSIRPGGGPATWKTIRTGYACASAAPWHG